MEIRTLQPEEYVQALRLAHSVFTYCLQQDIADPQQIAGFEAYTEDSAICGMAERDEITLWGVFAENRMVGMSAMQSEGHITMIYIYPAFQGRGYGRALLEEMKGYAGSRYGHRSVSLNAMPVRTAGFFAKCGFSALQNLQETGLPFLPMRAKTPSYAVYEKKEIPSGWILGTSIGGLIACTIVAVAFMMLYF
jgi:ribosomal protein S18 acetylase RimI-like enzyme